MTLTYILMMFYKAFHDVPDSSRYGFQSKGETYQSFMPLPVITPEIINPRQLHRDKVRIA